MARGALALMLSSVAALSACDQAPSRVQPPVPRIGESALDEPFVVFTERSITIRQRGLPVPAPVTVGSSPSPTTLVSAAPEIVAIDASGALVGLREGVAEVRSASGETLLVEVRFDGGPAPPEAGAAPTHSSSTVR